MWRWLHLILFRGWRWLQHCLTMVESSYTPAETDLARVASDDGGCQTANCSACTGGVWEVVSNTELSKLWYINTEASFISCLLINTCILYLITIHNMESVLIFYIVSGSSLWFIYWYWYHNGEYLYFPPSLLIRELIKDFWTILGYLPRGKWVTNKLSHWRRVANHMHICINIRSKRSHHWYW